MTRTPINGPGEFLGFLAQLGQATGEPVLGLCIPREFPVTAVWEVEKDTGELKLNYEYGEHFEKQ